MVSSIIEGADGITLTSTGLVAVREYADFVENALAGKSEDTDRYVRFLMTINHETTHFIQCFTASFPYSFSLSILEISSQVMDLCRSNRMTPECVIEFKNSFRSRIEQYKSQYQNLTTIDILEAMAVTEGYRATVVDAKNNPEDFHSFLNDCFPNPDSKYRKAIDIVTKMLGKEAGYELTPQLCYIALNGDTPAKNFWFFVDSLSSDRNISISGISSRTILQLFDMDIESTLLRLIENGLPKDSIHPIFDPFMIFFSNINSSNINSLTDRYEFAAKPGQRLRGDDSSTIRKLVPPLLVCSGGRGIIMGLGSSWSKEELFLYLDASAMIGACLTLLSGENSSQMCTHEQCPVHHSALCHSWFAKPHDIHWSQCAFPKRIQVQFGMDFQDIIKLFN